MTINRELSQFANFITVDESGNNNVGIATTVRISGGGGVYVGGIEVIGPTGIWKGPGSGLIGSQGIQGIQGTYGTQGFQGVQGTTGSQGTSGDTGTGGSQGTQGTQGLTGSSIQGSQGITGSASAVIPSGSVFLLYQANAPTGWTKVTTQNNKALRVVSGTGGGTGGSTAFTSVFASRTPAGSVSVSGSNSSGSIANATVTGSVSGTNSGGSVSNTTLSTSEIPSHSHSSTSGQFLLDNGGGGSQGFAGGGTIVGLSPNTTSTGGGNSHGHGFSNPSWSGSVSMNAHSHTFTNPTWSGSGSFTGTAMDFAVQYIDVIICSKD